MAENRIAEAERTSQIVQCFLVALDVHENIVRLVDLRDGIGQLAPTPVLEAVHAAIARGNHPFIALDHGGHLLALIGMDEKNDLVMPHDSSLRVISRPCEAAWCGKENARAAMPPVRSFGRAATGQSERGAKDTQSPYPTPLRGERLVLHHPRCRAASYKSIPAATDTFRLSTVPRCGR